MTPVDNDTIVLGNKHDRNYQDMVGRPLRVGDFFAHATARSSSVSMNVYKVKELVDTDSPVYVGGRYDHITDTRTTVKSWDSAFKIKAIRCELDRVKGRVTLPKVWQTTDTVNYTGSYVDVPEEDHKPTTISAVDRVVRLDLDV